MSNLATRNVKKIKFDQNKEKYSIIIAAAGKGTRLKNQEPKCLLKLDSHNTVLSRQIEIINDKFPVNEIILVVGHEADYIMNNTPQNIIKIENEGFETTNVARSISIGLRAATTDKVIVMMGDLVFSSNLLSGKFQYDSLIFTDNRKVMKEEEIGCVFSPRPGKKESYVDNLMFGQSDKWAQIAYLTGNELDLFKKVVWKRESANLFAFECLNKVIDMGGLFIHRTTNDAFSIDIDINSDLDKARTLK